MRISGVRPVSTYVAKKQRSTHGSVASHRGRECGKILIEKTNFSHTFIHCMHILI